MRGQGGIIYKLLQKSGAQNVQKWSKTEREAQKTLKKVLDNGMKLMYNSNVPPDAACTL